MVLVNQDMDMYTAYTKESTLVVAVVACNGVYFGYNLYCDDMMLGTFDSPERALEEVENIKDCKNPVYVVQEEQEEKQHGRLA